MNQTLSRRKIPSSVKRRDRVLSTLYIPLSLMYAELMMRAFTFGSETAGQMKPRSLLAVIMICASTLTIKLFYGGMFKAKLQSGASKKDRTNIFDTPLVISFAAAFAGTLIALIGSSILRGLLAVIMAVSLGVVLSRLGKRILSPAGILFVLIVSSAGAASVYGGMTLKQIISVALFSLSWGAVETLILTLCPNKKLLHIIAPVLLLATTVIFCIQRVVYSAFSTFFGFDAAGAANHLGDFSKQAFTAILHSVPSMLFLFLPTALMIALFKKCSSFPRRNAQSRLKLGVIACLPFIVMAAVIVSDKGSDGLLNLYNHPEINETAKNFGVLTSARLEFDTVLFGHKKVNLGRALDPNDVDNPFESGNQSQTDPVDTDKPDDPHIPVEYGYNVTDIDFDALIEKEKGEIKKASAAKKDEEKELHETILAMHEYYSSLTPTKKNEYTGMFAGKNLIFMTLEGFSDKVISPELTPTLYKMSTEGFVFNNFYCSMWGGSTATGEYANLTGLFYNKASCLETSASKYMPGALGNMFAGNGYTSYAFHGNSADYYHRDISHPNFGFEYIARGTGVEELTDRNGDKMEICWPTSDIELADVTVDLYLDKQPFLAYYMTLSGHGYYSWKGNKMSVRHRSETDNRGLTDELQAYYAAQLEVEGMMKHLIDYLDEAGILDDTVFVLSCDHYPYMMGEDSLSKLYELPEEGILKNYDLYRNTLFIWSSCMKEPVVIDTPCSSIDIIPTVYNLFGLEYDSRLYAGTDILSDTDPLVIMNGVAGPYWGFINRYGSYSTIDGFVPADGYEADDKSVSSYVKQMRAIVNNRKNYTFKILENDYFRYLYGK